MADDDDATAGRRLPGTAARYRRNAAELRMLAARSPADIRESLLGIAIQFELLATEAERPDRSG